ncbi:MAG TPA: type II secretion system protein [Bacillota bacterium]|nr:type II secretion system protein [Bacillota bacterium]
MRNDSGFTLIEVMVSLSLMGFLLIGMSMMPMQMRALRANAEARATAVSYAENIIEQYRNMDYDTLPNRALQPIKNLRNADVTKNMNLTYRYSVVVKGYNIGNISANFDNMLTSTNVNPQVKQVRVRVTWQGERLNGFVERTALIPKE